MMWLLSWKFWAILFGVSAAGTLFFLLINDHIDEGPKWLRDWWRKHICAPFPYSEDDWWAN